MKHLNMYPWMIKINTPPEWKNEAVILSPANKEQFESNGNKMTVMVPTAITDDNFGLYDIEMAPRARGTKLHYHKLMDETFVIREGTLTILTPDGEVKAEAGSVVHVPRFTAHGYNNDSDSIVKMTMIFNPGINREVFFREMFQLLDERPEDLTAFQKLYLRHDSYALNEDDMIPTKK